MKKLSVIIVNYNVRHFLEQTLLSVLKSTGGIDTEIIVVDNNSVDGSVELVKKKFPQVILIDNKVNLGFSKANNQAIRMAKGEYILMLNPDTVVEEDTFKKCCDFMDQHPDAGGLGVKMVDGKGKFLPESKRGLPSPEVAFYKIFGLSALFPKSRKFGKYHLGFLHPDEIHQVDILSGAYMFLRKSVLDEIGLLDEDYFMYGEDIDLSYRIIKAGYKNYYFPKTRIIHYKGESTKKTSINYVFIFYKAMAIFAGKHFSTKNAWTFSILINLAIYFRAFISISQRIVKRITLPLTDAAFIFGGFYLLKNFWEAYIKQDTNYYPEQYMSLVVPIYILIWWLSLEFSGAYSRNAKVYRLFQGIILGTLVISAVSNFAEELRFSKALIILGTLYTFIALLSVRLLIHYKKFKNLFLGFEKKKKVVVIGKNVESHRIINKIKEAGLNLEVAGYIHPDNKEYNDPLHLGAIEQLQEICILYQIDEVIFCSKDIPAHQIIDWMTKIKDKYIEYKIAPDESNFIIGSSSKDKQGDFYTLQIGLNIFNKANIRNKRILDVCLSLFFIIGMPIIIWLVQKPNKFIKNTFLVLSGKYSWVGFAGSKQLEAPILKKGIISPASILPGGQLDHNTINQLNMGYAKNYNLSTDLVLIFKSFRKLGV